MTLSKQTLGKRILEYARTNKIDMFTNYMEAEEFEKTHITKPLDIKSPIVVVGKKRYK